jgi:hypothetical protein
MYNTLPPLPAGRAAGVAAVPPLIYKYILIMSKGHGTVKKICAEIF